MDPHPRTQPTPAAMAPWPRLVLVTGSFVLLSVVALLVVGALTDGAQSPLGLVIRAAAGVLIMVLLGLLMKSQPGSTRISKLGFGALRTGVRSFFGVGMTAAVGYGLFFGLAWIVGAATVNTTALSEALNTTLVMVPLLLIAVGLPEELVFRGYLQHLLGQRFATMTHGVSHRGWTGIFALI